MLNMIQKHIAFCALLLLALFLTGCDGSQNKQTDLARKRRKEKNEKRNEAIIRKNEQIDIDLLRQMVENEKKMCPKDVGAGITVEDVELKDTAMIIRCECRNENFLKALDSDLKDDVRKSITLSICQNENDVKRMRLLKKTNTAIVYLFNDDTKKQSYTLSIPADQLPDSIPSPKIVEHMARTMFVNNLNSDLPQKISNVMTQQKAELLGDDVVISIVCDEDVVDMDKVKETAKENKRTMLQAMKNDPEGTAFLKTVEGLNCNIVYRYQGSQSGKTVDIAITKNDMN